MTVRLGLLFFFPSLPISPFHYCTTGTLPSLLDTVFSWTHLPIPRLDQDALRTVHPLPLSITCLTLAVTVLLMRASVPADVHPLCPHLLTTTLCIIAPSVHTSQPSNMCSTTPLVRALVV